MKCFHHHSADAVGICKNCSKGLCPDCLTDVGGGIACRDTCVDEVIGINRLVKRRMNDFKFMPYVLIGAGLLYASRTYQPGRWGMAFVMSIFLLAWGVGALVVNIKDNYGRK